MNSLNTEQLKDYEDNGFISPIDVLSLEETEEIKKEIEYIEKKQPDELMNKNDMILKNTANEELSKIFYKDAKKIGKY